MEPMFLLAILITLLFTLGKFVEYKYFQKEDEKTPLKFIVRDILTVLACSLGGSFLYFHFQSQINDFFNIVSDSNLLGNNTPQVFTDTPPF